MPAGKGRMHVTKYEDELYVLNKGMIVGRNGVVVVILNIQGTLLMLEQLIFREGCLCS